MDKTKYFSKSIFYLIIIVILISLDQITKEAVVANLMGSDPYIIIDNILELGYVENRGAAFGMMTGMRVLFLIIAPLVSIALFTVVVGMPEHKKFIPLKLAFTGIIAGALGNFIDRLVNGYVVDFIYFKPINFPYFNVADIYVTCSCAFIILSIAFIYKDEDFKELKFFS